MNYRLSPSAERDLREIWRYTADVWGIAQAEHYLKRLEARLIDLAAQPDKGGKRPDIGLASLLCYREARHLIFYQPYREGIAVARVLHCQMDIARHLEDDSSVS